MKLWGLLSLLPAANAATAYGAVAAKSCTEHVGCSGYYRAFGVTTSPVGSSFGDTTTASTVTGVSVAAIGAQATNTGTVAKAKVDVAGFRFKTPADTSDGNNKGLSFYFGFLGITGNWDSSAQTKNMNGALAEIVASISSVNVYYDYDGVPGFSWDIAQPDPTKRYDIFDCAKAATDKYDCVAAVLKVEDLIWTPISHSKIKCKDIPELSTYADACEIHSLTTSGSHSSYNPGTPVISFTIRIASQPLLIDGMEHRPDAAKWDIKIDFPWGAFSVDPTRAKLALVTVAAGKSAAFAASAKRVAGTDSLTFESESGNAKAFYGYTADATIDGSSGVITTQIITGAQIQAFVCAANSPCKTLSLTTPSTHLLVEFALKPAVNWVQLFGWKASIAIHSLGDKVAPNSVFWDPEVGASESPAAIVVPTFFFALFAFFL